MSVEIESEYVNNSLFTSSRKYSQIVGLANICRDSALNIWSRFSEILDRYSVCIVGVIKRSNVYIATILKLR